VCSVGPPPQAIRDANARVAANVRLLLFIGFLREVRQPLYAVGRRETDYNTSMRKMIVAAAFAVFVAASQAPAVDSPTPEFEKLRPTLADPAQDWTRLPASGTFDGWKPVNETREGAQRPNDWKIPATDKHDPSDETKLISDPYQRSSGAESLAAFVNNRDGKSASLASPEEYGDLEVYIEFVVPKGSNSGICLMGNYEIQIQDSYGEENLRYGSNGGIYAMPGKKARVGGRPPSVNVSRKPGEWQSLHIWFRAPRFGADGKKVENARFLKVEHNGKQIHEEYELFGSTRAVSPWPERAKAPLLLQGDHGPVAFRNLWVRPLRQDTAQAPPSQ
jgi:hypothetical protein